METFLNQTPEGHVQEKDRTSLGFFVDLRDKIFEKIGIPDPENFMREYQAIARASRELRSLGQHVESRENLKGIQRVGDKIKDIFQRSEQDITQAGRVDWVLEGTRIASIKKGREIFLERVKKYETFKPSVDSLLDIEHDPDVKEILDKYKKAKVSELLDEQCAINERDLTRVLFLTFKSLEYRNRKINEFVAYRYARVAPLDGGVNNFVKNAHTVLDAYREKNESGQNGYRREPLKSGREFFAPISSKLVEPCMEVFETSVSGIEKSDDVERNQIEALKNYIIFELVHPFKDGNGRTGRALFVYLQRYFSQTQNMDTPVVHIPVSRVESGTNLSDIIDIKGSPGSLSVDVDTLVKEIMFKKEVRDLCEDALSKETSGIEEVPERLVSGLKNFLDSKDAQVPLRKLLETIKKQSSLDTVSSPDLGLVYDSLKDALK